MAGQITPGIIKVNRLINVNTPNQLINNSSFRSANTQTRPSIINIPHFNHTININFGQPTIQPASLLCPLNFLDRVFPITPSDTTSKRPRVNKFLIYCK
jgi:hypothetical protein